MAKLAINRELNGCVPFLLTSWLTGWVVRGLLFCLVAVGWSWLGSNPDAEKFFSGALSLLFLDFHYCWLLPFEDDSIWSEEITNSQYPDWILLLPFLTTLLLGMIVVLGVTTWRNSRAPRA